MASITLYTQIDTSGAVADTRKLTAQIQTALKNGDVALARHTQSWLSASQSVEVYSARVEQLTAELAQLQTMQPTPTASPMYQQYEQDIQSIERYRATLDNLQARINAVTSGGGNAGGLQLMFDSLNGQLTQVQERADAARIALLNAQGVDVEARTDALTRRIIQQKEALQSVTNRANIAKTSLEQYSDTGSLVDNLSTKFANLGSLISRTLKRVAIYATLVVALRSLIKVVGNVMMSNDEFRNSLYRLQAALWTAFAPINAYIIPALTHLIDMLTSAITAVVKFIAFITGKSYSSMVANGKALYDQSKAYEKLSKKSKSGAKGMKKVTDEAKKQIAAFDELEILKDDTKDDKTGGGGAGAYDISPFEATVAEISTVLATMQMFLGGVLLAVGIVMLFIGAPKGIAIATIIAGLGMYISGATALKELDISQYGKTLLALTATAGGALLALGVILLFLGSIGWGLAAIISGVALLVGSAVGMSTFKTNGILSMLQTIEFAAGGALLALGIILLYFNGPSVVSIGCLVAGAMLLTIATAQLAEGAVEGDLRKFIETATTIASAALLALGIIMLCFGQITPLSIGLVVAGALGLATEYALNFKAVNDRLVTFFKENGALIFGVGTALVLIGICLCMMGIFPLGIGCLVAGGASLAAAIAPNWGKIVDKVKEVWGMIEQYWRNHIAKYFTSEWWGNLAKKALNGLIAVIEKGLNFLTTHGIVGFINNSAKALNTLSDALGINFKIPTIPQIKIPRLAQGMVIPPNRPFLAMLGDQTSGTNIETQLSTMVEAFNMALDSRNGSFGGGNTTVVLEVDGREFGRAVVEQGNRETRRIGTKLVVV